MSRTHLGWVITVAVLFGCSSRSDEASPTGDTPGSSMEATRDSASTSSGSAAVPGPSTGSAANGSGASFDNRDETSPGAADNTGIAGTSGADSSALPPQPTGSNDGDRYTDVGTNPFVMAAHDPFSTFAADVDTASYDLLRRDVNLGMLPQPTSVRLEEYVNYFDYDYPAPSDSDEHPFRISLAAAPNILDAPTTLLRVGIQALEPPPVQKAPTNLVFLIDTSGSMQSADKLPLVQHLLTRSLEVLDPTDTVSIVTYASGTGVALEPTEVSARTQIEDVINHLTASGSTNGAGGIQLAYEQAEASFIEGGINHVILCTDGDFNVGVTSDDALVELIEEKRRTGITLTALGFGIGNLNDSMMERVSNAGNGIYSVISSELQASRYAESDMLATLVHIAKDMKIQVEFNEEQVLAYRLLGYENRAIADDDFRDDLVDAGEVGAGHRVTALYELVLSEQSVPEPEGAPQPQDGEPVEGQREIDSADLVLVKVRYKDVDATEQDPAYEVATSLAPEQVLASHQDADEDFRWAVAVAAFAEILKDSPYAGAQHLGSIGEIVHAQAERDPTRNEFAGLFDQASTLLP